MWSIDWGQFSHNLDKVFTFYDQKVYPFYYFFSKFYLSISYRRLNYLTSAKKKWLPTYKILY